MSYNPRVSNGHRRRELTERVRARQDRCAICGGPIDYSLHKWRDPKDGKVKQHPMSFEVDEIKPVKEWRAYGYASKTAAATDPGNVQASHRFCNQWRGARSMRWVAAHRHELRAELARRGYARWRQAAKAKASRKKVRTSRSW